MANISVSLPSDGDTIDVADYNTPITTIVNEINGNLDNSNISASAAIAVSKLATGTGGVANANLNTTAGDIGGAYKAYTSTITAQTGTATTVTQNVSKYSVVGKTVHYDLDITITNKGSASNALYGTLPVAAKDTCFNGCGSENSVTGAAAKVSQITDTSHFQLTTYENGTPWVDTYRWVIHITYEAA